MFAALTVFPAPAGLSLPWAVSAPTCPEACAVSREGVVVGAYDALSAPPVPRDWVEVRHAAASPTGRPMRVLGRRRTRRIRLRATTDPGDTEVRSPPAPAVADDRTGGSRSVRHRRIPGRWKSEQGLDVALGEWRGISVDQLATRSSPRSRIVSCCERLGIRFHTDAHASCSDAVDRIEELHLQTAHA